MTIIINNKSNPRKPLTDFYRFIRPGCIGAPEPLIDSCILKAAIEFCERTRMWREVNTVQSTGNDPIPAPADSAIIKLEDARVDGRRLEPIAVADLGDMYPGQDWMTLDPCDPCYVTQMTPNAMMLVPSPAATVSVKLVMQLKPSQSAEHLPHFLYDLYQQVIADGAMAEILATPGQSYTNPDMAGIYSARFQQKLDTLSVLSIKGQHGAPVRTTPSYF